MIKKYITRSGVTIEVGDFYGGGQDEVVTSFEVEENECPLDILIKTTVDSYKIPLGIGDYLGMDDGSGKIVKGKNDNL